MSDLNIAKAVHMERNLLHAITEDNSHYFEAERIIRPEYWFNSWNRAIWLSMGRLAEEKLPIEVGTLISDLTKNGQLDQAGGVEYIVDLEHTLIRARTNVVAYCLEVKDAWDLRELQKATYAIAVKADGNNGGFHRLRADLESQLLSHSTDSVYTPEYRHIDLDNLLIQMEQERNRTDDLLGLPSGIRRLDALTHGFQRGEITMLGASSGGGKTGFLAQCAVEACRKGVPTLLFSLEMDKAAMHRRLVCIVSGVPFPRCRDPRWASKADMKEIYAAAEEIKTWPLYINDASGISIQRLTATARLYIRRHSVGFVGVDYVQIVDAPGKDDRVRVSNVSRGLTKLAKDEQVPVLALSQLSRPDRRDESKVPNQSALRESSQLENDAHVIILLHRERDPDSGRWNSEGKVRIAKQRNGETADYPVWFDRASLTFTDTDTRLQSQEAA